MLSGAEYTTLWLQEVSIWSIANPMYTLIDTAPIKMVSSFIALYSATVNYGLIYGGVSTEKGRFFLLLFIYLL